MVLSPNSFQDYIFLIMNHQTNHLNQIIIEILRDYKAKDWIPPIDFFFFFQKIFRARACVPNPTLAPPLTTTIKPKARNPNMKNYID